MIGITKSVSVFRMCLVGLAIAGVLTCSAGATPPIFRGLGVLPGASDSGALSISPNGTWVAGYSTTAFGDRAIRWSLATGMQSLGVLPGGLDSRGVGISADGKTVVGYSNSPGGYRAFRWSTVGGMVNLGTLSGSDYSLATAVSNDGSVVVGYSLVPEDTGTHYRAFRWMSGTGMQSLGLLSGGVNSFAQGVSGDGSVIIGVGDSDGSFDFRAFRHTSSEGMVNLGTLPEGNYTIGFGVSADGSTVVGYGRAASENLSAFRWTNATGMQDLGAYPGADFTIARSVSADGSIVVGGAEALLGNTAFLWTAKLGIVNLNTYLSARGIDLTGWTLTVAYAISSDGLTIAGKGDHNGHEEAWVVFLGQGQDLTAIEQLGKSIMMDANLSSPAGQACISCHSQGAGFTNPLSGVNAHGAVHAGAVKTLFGNRRPPTAAYAGQSPPLHLEDGTWIGGVFFDGRAAGWTLGDPLVEQAMFPLLNPLEQNNPGPEAVIAGIASSNYASLFRDVWGEDSLPNDGSGDTLLALERVGRSIAAYERSREVNPFNSRYDQYLAGRIELTTSERQGLALFEGIAGCSACHPNRPGPNGEPPLFTDFSYDNIGLPANPENPFYTMAPEHNPDGAEFVDGGLGAFLQQAGFPQSVFGPAMGKHKVPTLRNVDRRPSEGFVRAYGHNGYFKTLDDVVHFYNTRDVLPWPPPEVPQNVNVGELGNLHMTIEQEKSLVAFLKTLTDQDVTPISCPADFDHSGFVDRDDFDAFVHVFEEGEPEADFDRSGFVDLVDFDLFVLAFEAGC